MDGGLLSKFSTERKEDVKEEFVTKVLLEMNLPIESWLLILHQQLRSKTEQTDKLSIRDLEKTEQADKLISWDLEKTEQADKLISWDLEKTEQADKLSSWDIEKTEQADKLSSRDLE